MEAGVTSRTLGVPCFVLALRNERLPKDFKGPRKVPNYTADQPPKAWIESYEMAMKCWMLVMLHVLSTSPCYWMGWLVLGRRGSPLTPSDHRQN